jgi:hypothetical protein
VTIMAGSHAMLISEDDRRSPVGWARGVRDPVAQPGPYLPGVPGIRPGGTALEWRDGC